MAVLAAVDLGASGGRVMAGTVRGGSVQLEAVHRFPNGVAEIGGHLRWDLPRLLGEIRTGLAKVPDAVSIGIDTWGVDYGLLDEDGTLLAPPIAYRDDRTIKVLDEVHRRIPPRALYEANGLQFLPFTTLYQLAAEQTGDLWERAAHLALIPDLIAHELTGVLGTERTNASTTGLLDPRTHEWSAGILDRLGIPRRLLPHLEAAGSVRGRTADGTPVVSVGSHDTASAVVGVPATSPNFAYIACGTWSLVGLELDRPVVTDAAFEANFTNELGVDGRTRFLRNVGGLWLLQECLRSWGRDDVERLVAAAGQLPASDTLIDVDDTAFVSPGQMPERIAAAVDRPLSEVETVRCILDSLATAFARTVHQAAALSGRRVDVIHLVGGGSQNDLLGQLTADAAQLPVVAGPVEATALGNVLVQARAHGLLPSTLEELRSTVAATTPTRRFTPS
jgi:rhamnulokinase